ncbi:uncharacterized protein LOC129785836 [Lutzomyia longipalpis]|uniref:uncharacterized protein LOC129785836 n=1 Tax=Lutzomyia longipalpis TaxID=7200 RepID=UPI002484277F|nr:uncharacterized protein LOC129785836 [Lutzomyia longipalpis]
MVHVPSFIFILLILINDSCGHPAAHGDLITGQDFLSLFTDSKNIRPYAEDTDKVDYIKNLEEDDTILPIEKLFLSNDEMVAESSNHFSFDRRTNRKLDTFTATATLKPPTPVMTDVNNSQLQLVKTGSKIIFIEQPQEENKDAVISSTTLKDETTTEQNPNSDKNVRVIAVSVSSSVAQRSSTLQRDFPVDATPSRRSGNDFSIEEDEPLTKLNKEISDSAREESMNVHSFVAPPDSDVVSQLPVAQPPSQQVRSRMQRKQDDVVPYQTLLYRNNEEKKDRAPLPRSISYTSLGQALINEPKLWRNYDVQQVNKTEDSLASNSAYSQPEKIYGEPSKVYSVPAKIYGQPSKVYSEPAKIYSEPAKIYSEPAKVYSEPAKVYGKPAQVYAQPPTPFPTLTTKSPVHTSVSPSKKIVFNLDKLPYDLLNRPQSTRPTFAHFEVNQGGNNFIPSSTPQTLEESTLTAFEMYEGPTPERNYEVDEAVSVMTSGRHHGIQPSPSAATPITDDAKKVGYVVEGRNFRKYRVEEKTADGFIVGEYGVVSNDDGNLRGVRYTADSNISPSLIYNALLKFLSL